MSSSTRWTIVVVLLLPAIVLPLLVGIYDRNDPELWGFPFYYWFQFLLIPVAAVLTTSAYLLTKGDERPPEHEDDPVETLR
jgi:CBS domain containing-hemolysin-like protein